MPRLNMSYTEDDLRRLVVEDIARKTGMDIKTVDVKILVKSKQNYKSEWESAAFKAEVDSNIQLRRCIKYARII